MNFDITVDGDYINAIIESDTPCVLRTALFRPCVLRTASFLASRTAYRLTKKNFFGICIDIRKIKLQYVAHVQSSRFSSFLY